MIFTKGKIEDSRNFQYGWGRSSIKSNKIRIYQCNNDGKFIECYESEDSQLPNLVNILKTFKKGKSKFHVQFI